MPVLRLRLGESDFGNQNVVSTIVEKIQAIQVLPPATSRVQSRASVEPGEAVKLVL